jgi:hypothetical protein
MLESDSTRAVEVNRESMYPIGPSGPRPLSAEHIPKCRRNGEDVPQCQEFNVSERELRIFEIKSFVQFV